MAWLRFECKVADKSLVWWGHISSGYVWPPSNFFNFIVETFESSTHKFREKVEIKTKKSASSEIVTKQHQTQIFHYSLVADTRRYLLTSLSG